MPVTGGYYPDSTAIAGLAAILHRNFNPWLIDATFTRQPTLLAILLRELAEERRGGLSPITQPVRLSNYSATISKLSWSGSFTANSVPSSYPYLVAEWNMAGYVVAMDISLPEVSTIQSPTIGPEGIDTTIIDAIKDRYLNYYMQLVQTIDAKLLTLQTAADEINSIPDAIDDGTNMATYGNINRATYPNWASVVYNAEGIPPNIPPDIPYDTGKEYQIVPRALYKFWEQVAVGSFQYVVLTSLGVFAKLASSMESIVQAIVETPDEVSFKRGIGIQQMVINGVPVIGLPQITTNVMYFINLNTFKFYIEPSFYFALQDVTSLTPVGTLGWRAVLTWAGNFVCLNPRMNFKVIKVPTLW